MGALNEIRALGGAYWNKHYPPFVYSAELEGFLPSFFYHDISTPEFESHLQYLSDNGYGTLFCAEALGKIQSGASGREALLTFDDGLASVYSVVYPLLQKFKMKAVSYIVPQWIGTRGFLAWDQCREMRRSGLVDFQSHSMAHVKVVTKLKLVGVWRKTSADRIPWGIPGYDVRVMGTEQTALPMMEGKSLFDGDEAWILPESFWRDCVKVDGKNPDRDALEREFNGLLKKYSAEAKHLRSGEKEAVMVEDLRASREAIERELPGQRADHFCFPWHANSPPAWKALEKAGFATAAVGIKGTDFDGGASVPFKIYRAACDFLPCLPGKKRKSFSQVVAGKILRRVRGENVYGIAD
jgi:hypothetical protein